MLGSHFQEFEERFYSIIGFILYFQAWLKGRGASAEVTTSVLIPVFVLTVWWTVGIWPWNKFRTPFLRMSSSCKCLKPFWRSISYNLKKETFNGPQIPYLPRFPSNSASNITIPIFMIMTRTWGRSEESATEERILDSWLCISGGWSRMK